MKLILRLFFIVFVFSACATSTKVVYNDAYPDIWWAPVAKDQLASWEIGPEKADRSKGEVILSKRNELSKLSNFYAVEFYLDKDLYGSIEGLWQSMKYPENKKDARLKDKSIIWPFTREQVRKMTAFEAKKAGDLASANMKKLGITWVTYKGKKLDYKGKDQQKHYDIIYRATLAKIDADCEVRDLLRRTGKLKLFPDHRLDEGAITPAYKYYDIYMKIRDSWAAQTNTPSDAGFCSKK
jgi:hypothetical protein